MRVLPKITKTLNNNFRSIISDFLWNGKTPRIAYDILTVPKNQGGLKLTDLNKRDQSLRIYWIVKYFEYEDIRTLANYALNNNKVGGYIWEASLKEKDINKMFRPHFWRDVLVAWNNYKYTFPVNATQVKNQVIWLNSAIKVEDNVIINIKAIESRLKYVRQILNEDGNFKSYSELDDQHKRVINFIDYYSICELIPYTWKRILRIFTHEGKAHNRMLATICDQEGVTSVIYQGLVENICVVIPRLDQWKVILDKGITIQEFHQLCSNIHAITNSAKLRSFQYKIM